MAILVLLVDDRDLRDERRACGQFERFRLILWSVHRQCKDNSDWSVTDIKVSREEAVGAELCPEALMPRN